MRDFILGKVFRPGFQRHKIGHHVSYPLDGACDSLYDSNEGKERAYELALNTASDMTELSILAALRKLVSVVIALVYIMCILYEPVVICSQKRFKRLLWHMPIYIHEAAYQGRALQPAEQPFTSAHSVGPYSYDWNCISEKRNFILNQKLLQNSKQKYLFLSVLSQTNDPNTF